MSENSKIQWTDHTFNPWIGCTKVSPGCANCYAEAQDKFRSWTPEGWGKGKPRRRTSESNWRKPLKWDREARYGQDCPVSGDPSIRPRVFCASLADWLDDEVPIEWLADLLTLIHNTPHLDWQLLTKRPQNWRDRIHQAYAHLSKVSLDGVLLADAYNWLKATPRPNNRFMNNVWIGTTVEDQTRANERIQDLLKIPARVRFLSCEPLLGPIDFRLVPGFNKVGSAGLDLIRNLWIICGGESGSGARPMRTEWAESLAEQCIHAGIPFFMKQLGGTRNHHGELSDFPEALRIRAFPR